MTPSSIFTSKNVFVALVSLSCFMLPLFSFHFGVTTDEILHQMYGEKLFGYYRSGGADMSCLSMVNLYLYGGLFDLTVAFVQNLMHAGTNYEVRHVVNALFGVLVALFTGLLAREFGTWRGALIAFVLLITSPRFLGHAMNNPKDIPFALGYVVALYAIVKYMKEFPKPRFVTQELLILGFALAIGVRVHGTLLFLYFFIVVGIQGVHFSVTQRAFKQFFFLVIQAVMLSLAGFYLGILFWPTVHESPFAQTIGIMKEMVLYTPEHWFLFEGYLISSLHTPWYYIPKWIMISTPFFIHAGLILVILLLLAGKLQKLDAFGVVILSIIFPLMYVVVNNMTLYNGWRHLLFVYPLLVVIVTVAWEQLFALSHKGVQKILVVTVLSLFVMEPVWWMVRYHPYQSVYFNRLVGGLEGAAPYYESDYWGNSLKEASEWLAKNDTKAKERILVQSIGKSEALMSLYYLQKSNPERYGFEPRNPDWDYSFLISRGLSRQERESHWPPEGTIYSVIVDKTVLAVVVDRDLTLIQ